MIEFSRVTTHGRTAQSFAIVDPFSSQNRRIPPEHIRRLQRRGQEYVIVEIHKALAEPVYPPEQAFDCQRIESRQRIGELGKDL